jgi:hypothetical protein
VPDKTNCDVICPCLCILPVTILCDPIQRMSAEERQQRLWIALDLHCESTFLLNSISNSRSRTKYPSKICTSILLECVMKVCITCFCIVSL